MPTYQSNRFKNQRRDMALARIRAEAKKIRDAYLSSFIECRINDNQGNHNLVCNLHFNIAGTECEAKIVYDGINPPKCWLISPTFNDPQHIYKAEGNLCLYDPKNKEWTNSSHVYNTFVPWCMEWVVFQMLYERTGIWQHPERHPGSYSDLELRELCNKYDIPFEKAKSLLNNI